MSTQMFPQVRQVTHTSRVTLLVLGTAGLLACGESTATLTIQLQPVPELTNEQTVTIQGTVSRTPEKETITVVTISGGTRAFSDSLASPGGFSIAVSILPNQETQLAVTASDAQGFVSEAVVVTILHDDIGPQIAQMSPASRSENVALDTPIEVEFQEPLIAQPGAQVVLLHNADPVPGDVTISADSLRVSFTPAATLEPGSVYQLTFSGFTDGTGNPVTVDTQACFLTSLGSLITHVDRDSADGGWVQGNPETTISRTDVSRIRYSRADSTMYVILEFTNDRGFNDGSNNNTAMFIEIDADQDPQTGFKTLRDTIFSPFPELVSDIGADFIFGLERLPEIDNRAYVGVMTSFLEFDIIEAFGIGICGRFWGFHHTAFLGTDGDDGLFDYTGIAFTEGTMGNLIDVVPESGFYTANVTGVQPPGPASYRDNIVRARPSTRLRAVLDRYLTDSRRGGRQ